MPQDWHASGAACCSPFDTFMLAWCCPCISYGRARHRLTKDADLQGYSCCNSSCIGYACLMHVGFNWVLQMMQRSDIRAKYGLRGNGCSDCLCACFCAPCDLVQQNKEIQAREKGVAVVNVQPQKMTGMQYGGPQYPTPMYDGQPPYGQPPYQYGAPQYGPR